MAIEVSVMAPVLNSYAPTFHDPLEGRATEATTGQLTVWAVAL
jgi:hypothetical protein